MEMNSDNSYLCSYAIIFVGRFLRVVRHLEDMLQCPHWNLDTYSAVSPWLQFSNKMAGEPVLEGKQVLFATEAELYIEQLKPYPLKEVGSSKWVPLVVWWCHFMFFSLDGLECFGSFLLPLYQQYEERGKLDLWITKKNCFNFTDGWVSMNS